jgi:hypothetical protein
MAINCHPHLTKLIIILIIISIILFVINYKEQKRQNFQDITLNDINQVVTEIQTNQNNFLKDVTRENLALIKQNLHNWQV